jgi:hypothetical protein
MKYRIAFPLLALLAAGGCNGKDATSPSANAVSSSAAGARASDDENSPRSGALHVTKECSQYTAQAGSFCTITSSNLKAITYGSKVVYEKGAVGALVDTDLILYAAGRGNNTAFGHAVVNLGTGTGVVTFSGGTGQFKGFHARVDVTPLGWPNFAWVGTYWFSENDGD